MGGVLDKILAAADAAEMVRVAVPEWSTDLYFRPLTAGDRARIRRGIKPDQQEALLVSTIQHKALDSDGKPVFEADPKTRDQLMAFADMSVVMRILREASIEQDPRATMLEGASLDGLRNLLSGLGDAPAGEVAELSDDMLEAIRALAMAKEWDLADALGGGAAEPESPIETAKNA